MSSTSTTPRSRLTIPLCQRIALFACRGPKDAFFLAVTNELFRETMIDYNTMHTVFCRRLWQVSKKTHDYAWAFQFVLRVAKNNVTWIIQILISALDYYWEKANKQRNGKDNDQKEFTFYNTDLSSAVHCLGSAALRCNHTGLTVELLRLLKRIVSFEAITNVGQLGQMVKCRVMEACSKCDSKVINVLMPWYFFDWPFDGADGYEYQEVQRAFVATCWTQSTASNAVEFFTELLTFDDHTSSVMMKNFLAIDSLSTALTFVCFRTDQPELVELFDRKLRENFKDKDSATLSNIWHWGDSESCGPEEFPLMAAAANCEHRVLLTVMSCLRNLGHSNIAEVYTRNYDGFTPFLKAVAHGLIKNVKILIAQCSTNREYQEDWLLQMVDGERKDAIALCGDANEEMKDFLLQEDCWEVSRRFYAQEMQKFSEVEKESGARRQREEGNAE